MSVWCHKRPIRNGRLGENKGQDGFDAMVLRLVIERRGGRDGGGTVMPTRPSASRECRGSAAARTLQGEAFQFGDKFIKDRITDLRQFEAGDPPPSCPRQAAFHRENPTSKPPHKSPPPHPPI